MRVKTQNAMYNRSFKTTSRLILSNEFKFDIRLVQQAKQLAWKQATDMFGNEKVKASYS